jgi:hypothetical protein
VRQDVRRDEPDPEAEAPDQLPADARLPVQNALDAWDGARRDAADAADLRCQELADVVAEKLAVRARDGRAQDAWFPQAHRSARLEQPDAAAELCTPDAVQSAAQSCAELAVAVGPLPQAQLDAAQPELAARQKQ